MTMTARWTPGDVPVAVAARGLVALDDAPEVLETLWADLEDGRELGDLLQHLARAHDNNVFALPDFLVVVLDGDRARAAARGRFRLALDTGSGPVHLAAPEVIAWDEVHAEDVRGATLDLAPAGPEQDGPTASWPLRSGIVTASRVAVGGAAEQDPGTPRTHPIAATVPVTGEAPPIADPGDGQPAPRLTDESSADGAERSPVDGADDAGVADEADGTQVPVRAPQAVPSIQDTGMTLGPEALEALEAQGPAGDAHPTSRTEVDPEQPVTGAPQAPGPDEQPTDPLAPHQQDAPTPAAVPGPAPEAQAEDDYFGHLFESTRATTVEEAAIRAARSDDVDPLARPTVPGLLVTDVPAPGAPSPATGPASPPAVPTPPEPAGGVAAAPPAAEGWQHDGRTVSAAQLRAAREAIGAGHQDAGVPAPAPEPPAEGPQVLAAFCVAGHPNPVHATACRLCGGGITASTGHVTRPPLGVLRCSTGASAVLDADVVVGRLPQGTNRPGGPAPHLMAVPSPGKAISKSHCAVRVQEWDVAVEDLGSTNGTFLLRPGESPRRVPEHSAVFLRTGDVIDLGDGITLTLERDA